MSNDSLKRFFIRLGRAVLFLFALGVLLLFSAIFGLAPWVILAMFGYVAFRFARMLIRFATSGPKRSRRRRQAFDPGTVGRPQDGFIRTLDQEFSIVPDYGPKE